MNFNLAYVQLLITNYQVQKKIQVLNTEYIQGESGVKDIVGEAYCVEGESGVCKVRFSVFAPWGDYRVLETDY